MAFGFAFFQERELLTLREMENGDRDEKRGEIKDRHSANRRGGEERLAACHEAATCAEEDTFKMHAAHGDSDCLTQSATLQENRHVPVEAGVLYPGQMAA